MRFVQGHRVEDGAGDRRAGTVRGEKGPIAGVVAPIDAGRGGLNIDVRISGDRPVERGIDGIVLDHGGEHLLGSLGCSYRRHFVHRIFGYGTRVTCDSRTFKRKRRTELIDVLPAGSWVTDITNNGRNGNLV